MGFFSIVFGLFGFGIGITIGLVIGYFLFIYWKSADVEDPIIRPLNELDSKSLEKLMPEIPLWVKNPDFDRVDWLNRFIGDLWPYLDKAICNIIRETTKPMLEEYRSKFKIDAIDFECLTLGTLPPTLQGIKAYDTAEREMIIEPALKWAGNPNIIVAVKAFGIKATVQLVDLQVFAVARVTLKPLVPCFPCFSKILVSLMDKPHIDFGLKLMGGDLMAIPGLYGMVQDIIKDQVGNMYLWPKALEVAVLDEKIATKKPVGMLQVKVISAQGLRKADFMGKSDPYVKLSLGGSLLAVKKTQVKMKTLNPVWNEDFMFSVQDPESQALELHLYDWERVSNHHDKLGMQVVPLHTLVPYEKAALTLNIVKNMNPNDPSNEKPRGQIMLELMYQPFKGSDTIFEEDEEGTDEGLGETLEAGGGMLLVHVHEAKDLEGKNSSNFYVKLTLRGYEKKTKCIKKTRNPRWDEEFDYTLEEAPVNDKIRVEVISKGKGFASYTKESVGYVDINLSDVVNNTRINERYRLIDSKTGEIQIELEWRPKHKM